MVSSSEGWAPRSRTMTATTRHRMKTIILGFTIGAKRRDLDARVTSNLEPAEEGASAPA